MVVWDDLGGGGGGRTVVFLGGLGAIGNVLAVDARGSVTSVGLGALLDAYTLQVLPYWVLAADISP